MNHMLVTKLRIAIAGNPTFWRNAVHVIAEADAKWTKQGHANYVPDALKDSKSPTVFFQSVNPITGELMHIAVLGKN